MSTQNVAARPRPHNAMFSAARVINPAIMLLAGTRIFPLYGVIHHRGRRSGKEFRTPVVVRPTQGGFIVPMPWGDTTDWYRNVRAAGGCTIHWKGRDYAVVDPVVLDAKQAVTEFSGPTRGFMARFGIRQVVKLRFRD